MDYTRDDRDGLDYFFIEVDCEECNNGKYKVYNAYDKSYCEEVECDYCEGTGKMLKKIPIAGSENKKKYLN